MLKKTASGIPTNIGPVVISRPTTVATRHPLFIDKFRTDQLLIEEEAKRNCFQETAYLRHGLNKRTNYAQGAMRRFAPSSSSSISLSQTYRKRCRRQEVKKILQQLTSEDAESIYLDVHKKCQLEVQDPKHRYGKFLRAYHKEWNRMGQPEEDFFAWLEGASVNLQHVPISALNAETVHYIKDKEAQNEHLLEFRNGRLYRHGTEETISTDDAGWIFVLQDGQFYASKKVTDSLPRFHHTSFVGGGRVQMAGIFMAEDGNITSIYPHSGHYRPRDKNLLLLLLCLVDKNCDLSKIEVDLQRTMRVSRESLFNVVNENEASQVKQPKMNCTLMWGGFDALDFLLSLQSWCESGIAAEIRKQTVVATD